MAKGKRRKKYPRFERLKTLSRYCLSLVLGILDSVLLILLLLLLLARLFSSSENTVCVTFESVVGIFKSNSIESYGEVCWIFHYAYTLNWKCIKTLTKFVV